MTVGSDLSSSDLKSFYEILKVLGLRIKIKPFFLYILTRRQRRISFLTLLWLLGQFSMEKAHVIVVFLREFTVNLQIHTYFNY